MSDYKPPSRRRRWRASMLAATTALVASAVAVPAAPAHADTTHCVVVDMETNIFPTGHDSGMFLMSITLTNECSQPLNGWTLELELPPGSELSSVWSALASQSGQKIILSNPDWASVIGVNHSYTFGLLGTYTGGFSGPIDCKINGEPCSGAPSPPPGEWEVTLTAPADGAVLLYPCPVTLTADVTVPAGSEVDRVEFYVDDTLVGTKTEAPYELHVRSLTSTHTAYARVYDTEDPPNSDESDPVTFTMAPPPPALLIVACAHELEVPAGGSASVEFYLSANTQVPAEVTVTGPGAGVVSVEPESFLLDGAAGQEVVVSAAHGAAPTTATLSVTAPPFQPTQVTVQVTNP